MPVPSEEILGELRTAFIGKSLVPVCGAGFSTNVMGGKNTPPKWDELVDRVRAHARPTGLDSQLDLLMSVKDYLSALTLIKRQTPEFDRAVAKEIQESTRDISQGNLPAHMAFWSVGWKVSATTNFDLLLETAGGRASTTSYQAPTLTNDFMNAMNAPSGERTVFHLHGALSTRADRPLLTWEDYFFAYGVDESVVDDLKSVLPRCVTQEKRQDYARVLSQVLSEAWNTHSSMRRDQPTRLPALLDRLLSDYTLLLVGFSFTDPFWQLVQLRLMSQYRGQPPRRPYLITTDKSASIPVPGAFHLIEIGSWKNLDQFFLDLADEFQARTTGGVDLERDSRISAYRPLLVCYPEFSGRGYPCWVYEDKKTIVPFVELWANEENLPPDQAIRLQVPRSKHFRLPQQLVDVREEYWNYLAEEQAKKPGAEPLTNEIKVRINHWKSEAGALYLGVEPIEYKDYLITNHFVANVGDSRLHEVGQEIAHLADRLREAYSVNSRFDPRAFLCGSPEAIRLRPAAQCSNHLGISALAIADYEPQGGESVSVLICPPSRDQISSPNDIIPTASGSADWPVLPDASSYNDIYSLNAVAEQLALLNVNREVRKEFVEECLSCYDIKDLSLGERRSKVLREADQLQGVLIRHQALINLCQNVERGGKPELFYLITLAVSANKFIVERFKPNWELDKLWSWERDPEAIFHHRRRPAVRRILLFPSPLSVDLDLSPSWQEACRYLAEVIREPAYNPVLRAHLMATLRFCELRFADQVRSCFAELGLSVARMQREAGG